MINSDLGNYLSNINNLRNLTRYQAAPRVSSESVAEHSFFVAAYVLKLYDFPFNCHSTNVYPSLVGFVGCVT